MLAGCGGSEDPAAEAPEGPSAPEFAKPRITSPVNGDTLTASAGLGDSFYVKVPVRGTAQPDTKLDVGAGCPVAGCAETVTTDETGKFKASVTARARTDEPKATIIVGYQVADSTDSDRIVITINPPKDGLPGSSERSESSSETKPERKRKKRSSPALPNATVAPPAATAPPTVTAAPDTTSSGTGSSGSAIVIGDSLAEGMAPYLKAAMPNWKLSVDARVGRPLAEGMSIFASAQPQPGTVSAFSLFTNDGPQSVNALESAVRISVQRSGCAVWATIVRPPVGGVSYDAANTKLRSLAASGGLAGRLQIVDWAQAVAQHPEWISASDGVHGTAAGYRNRASMYARAIDACG